MPMNPEFLTTTPVDAPVKSEDDTTNDRTRDNDPGRWRIVHGSVPGGCAGERHTAFWYGLHAMWTQCPHCMLRCPIMFGQRS